MGLKHLRRKFEQYAEALDQGEHLLVIDVVNSDQETAARYSVESHLMLRAVN